VKVIAAYGVHLLTALGAVLGLWSIILIYDGFYQHALWVLGVAVLIDSVDGALARLVQTKKYAPLIDGALLDNIIDYITWTIAPLFWLHAMMSLPVWVLLACALASAFGFSNVRAKTEDHYFLGFPSYWNIVVFYIFVLDFTAEVASAILLVFAVMTFLPIKFLYPSRNDFLRPITFIFGTLFVLQLMALIYFFDKSPRGLIYSSFLFPVYYFSVSFYLNLKKSETTL
jgi:phosphatidylcholine synthase